MEKKRGKEKRVSYIVEFFYIKKWMYRNYWFNVAKTMTFNVQLDLISKWVRIWNHEHYLNLKPHTLMYYQTLFVPCLLRTKIPSLSASTYPSSFLVFLFSFGEPRGEAFQSLMGSLWEERVPQFPEDDARLATSSSGSLGQTQKHTYVAVVYVSVCATCSVIILEKLN